MGRSDVAVVCTVALLTTAFGARVPLQLALAPAPALVQGKVAGSERADVTFFLSAEKATFTSPTTLVLQRPAGTVASFQAGGRSIGEPTAEFASAAQGARFVDSQGQWLGQPDALLQGSVNGSSSDVLLVLSQPVFDRAAETLTFTVGVLPPLPASAKLLGGVVSRRIGQYEAGVGAALIQVVGAGVELEDVGLFIDQNHSGLQKSAELKFGWGGSDSSVTSTGSPPPSGR